MSQINKNQPVVIKLDGSYVKEVKQSEVLAWFHRNHSYSMDHALQFEGYSLHPVTFDVFIGGESNVVATKTTQLAADRMMQKLANENPTAGWKRVEA